MRTEAYELMSSLETDHWWYRARREILGNVIRQFLPTGSRLLDYGCGSGGTSRYFAELGYRVVCADRSESALSRCIEWGFETIDLRKAAPPHGIADAILLFDVLEHVEDDRMLLLQLAALLPSDGHLFVTVPAYEWLWSGEDFVSEHFRRYTARSLRQDLDAAGFQVRHLSYFNSILLPAIAASIVSRRIFRPRSLYRSNVKPTGPFLNGLLYRVFRSERRVVPRLSLPFGASLVAVTARR